LLAAGERIGRAVGKLLQTGEVQDLCDAREHLFARNAEIFQPEGQLFPDGEPCASDLVERISKHQADLACQLGKRRLDQIALSDVDGPDHSSLVKVGDEA